MIDFGNHGNQLVHKNRVWKGISGIRDLTKIQFGIRETLNGIRDFIKIQFGIRETYLNGIRALTATRKAGFAKIWARMRTGKVNDIRGGDDRSWG